MKVILVSGKAQHGKDTAAQYIKAELEEHGETVLIAHYADLVKYICKTFFGWDGSKDEYGRHILQYVGTDVIRSRYPNYWVDFLSEILSIFSDEWDFVIIPDTRFPNEVSRMVEAGFDVTHIRVMRDNFVSPLTEEQQKHLSETALDNSNPDILLMNDGSLEHYEEIVRKSIKEAFYE